MSNQKIITSYLIKAEKNHVFFQLVLCIIFLILSAFLLLKNGLINGADTYTYLRKSELLSIKTLKNGHYTFYTFYIIIVHLFKNHAHQLIVFQWLFYFISVNILYFAISKKNSFTAILYLIFTFANYDQWKWCFTIMTESIFISLLNLIIASLIYLSYSNKSNNNQLYALTTITLLLLCFTRPNGLLIAIAISFILIKSSKTNIAISLLLLTGILLFLKIGNSDTNALHFIINSFQKGRIIGGSKYTLPIVSSPTMILDCTKLILFKLILFITGYRPYFSTIHNIVNFFLYSPLFIIAAYTFYKKFIIKNKTIQFCHLVILLHLIMISFSHVDWDCRFLIQITPCLQIIYVMYFGETLMTYKKRFKPAT